MARFLGYQTEAGPQALHGCHMDYRFISYLLMTLLLVLTLFSFRIGRKEFDGRRDLLTANSVICITFLVYVVFSSSIPILFNDFRGFWVSFLHDPEHYIPALLISLYALAAYDTAYFAFAKAWTRAPRDHVVAAKRSPRRLAWLMILLGTGMKLYVIAQSGGIQQTILQLSEGMRDTLGIDRLDGPLVAIRHMSGIADAAAVWLWLSALRTRKRLWLATLVLFAVLALAYLGTGKRLYLLASLVAVGLGFSHYVRPVRLSWAPAVVSGALLVGMVTLLFRSLVPAAIAGYQIDLRGVYWSGGSLLSFYVNSLEFSTFEMMTVATNYGDDILSKFGGALGTFYASNIEPFLYVVPRALWPGKPESLQDISYALNAYVNRGGYVSESGWATTGIGSSWAIGGLVGLTAYMALIGATAAYSDRFARADTGNKDLAIIGQAVLITVVFHLFRQGSIGWTFVVVVTQQIGFISGFAALWITSRPVRDATRNFKGH